MRKKKTFAHMMGKSEMPVLVDFHATWCGPCHTMSPIIQDIARDFSGKVKVIKIDVDRNQGVAMKYGIRGVPTLILFKKGNILWRHSGILMKTDLTAALKNKL